jgi:hypothetical protein
MGRKPGERVMGLLEGRAEAISGEFTSQGIQDLLWAYDKLGFSLSSQLHSRLMDQETKLSSSLSAFVAAAAGQGVPAARCDAVSVSPGSVAPSERSEAPSVRSRATDFSEASTVAAEAADSAEGWSDVKPKGKRRG